MHRTGALIFGGILTLVLCTGTTWGEPPQAQLPDAPSQRVAPTPHASKKPATQTLLADDPYVPLTGRQKFDVFVKHTYAPGTFMSAAWNAGWAHLTGANRYGPGMNGFAQSFGASLANTEARSLFGTFLFPTLLHQDPRYLPKRRGSWTSRAIYAVSRVAITRRDDGRSAFNSSELLGVAFSQSLCNAYYPEKYRGWGDTFNRMLGAYQGDATGYLLSEFWPDIMRAFRRHAPRKIRQIEEKVPGMNTAP